MGRKLLADPELVAKLARGRNEDVRPCIYCYVCVAQPFFDRRVRCAVNPVTGNEAELAERVRTPAASRKRVSSWAAARRGWRRRGLLRCVATTSCCANEATHSAARCASRPWSTSPTNDCCAGSKRKCAGCPIEVRLGCAASRELVREVAPDVVIAAVGPRRERSVLPGARPPARLRRRRTARAAQRRRRCAGRSEARRRGPARAARRARASA